MAKISIDQIKKLREVTGAAVMDCCRALKECQGNLKEAQRWLAKKGIARADKKKDRETKAGQVASYVHATGRVGALVALACETDFVARTPEFSQLAHELCLQVASMKPKDLKALLAQEYVRDPKITIEELIKQTIAKLGENIRVVKIERVEI